MFVYHWCDNELGTCGVLMKCVEGFTIDLLILESLWAWIKWVNITVNSYIWDYMRLDLQVRCKLQTDKYKCVFFMFVLIWCVGCWLKRNTKTWIIALFLTFICLFRMTKSNSISINYVLKDFRKNIAVSRVDDDMTCAMFECIFFWYGIWLGNDTSH